MLMKITFAALGLAALAIATHLRRTPVIVHVTVDVGQLLDDLDEEDDRPGDYIIGDVAPLTQAELRALEFLDFKERYTE